MASDTDTSSSPVKASEEGATLRAAIDRSARLPVLFFFTSSVLWLVVASVLGFLAAMKLHWPGFLDYDGLFFLNYGMVKPAFVAAFVYGWAIQAGLGVAIWITARLCRAEIRNPLTLIVAGYFWARWFAMGLGLSGAISAMISVWQVGPEPVLVFYGGTHLAVAAVMWGKAMSGVFDGRKEWRERFRLDDNSTHKLGKAIVRAGVSLPYILMYALAPRTDAATTLAVAGGAGLAVAGIWALTRMRTWGIFALAGSAVALLA